MTKYINNIVLFIVMELNLSEKKVLSLLEIDCRLPANQIAKKVRLSTEGVIKIIKRLQERGIIQKFNTKINYSKMGYRLYPVHIKLVQRNKQIVQKITSIVKRHQTCAWHMFCEGEYDLLLSFSIREEKSKEDIASLLDELAPFILEKEMAIVLHAFEINKSFIENHKPKIFMIFDYQSEYTDFKAKEHNLINLMRQNSRETFINIAKKQKVDPRTIIGTIKKLQKNNVISGFKTKINMAKLGYQPCIALITINQSDKKQYDLFVSYCKQIPGIHYFVRQFGKYDIELTFDVENIHSFYGLIEDIRNKFPFVQKITTLIIKKNILN